MTNQRPERASTLSKSVYPRGDPIFKSKITFILVTWFIQTNDHINHVTEYRVAHCLDCGYEAKIIFRKFQNIDPLKNFEPKNAQIKKWSEKMDLFYRIKSQIGWSALKSEITPLSVSSKINFCSRFEW